MPLLTAFSLLTFKVWHRATLFFLLAISGACAPPEFEREFCTKQCDQCSINSCAQLCGDLEMGIESDSCNAASEELWRCAITVGCTFGEDCNDEVVDFLLCDPTE